MARGKSKPKRRSKNKGALRLMPIIFSLATLNVISRAAFNNSLAGFAMGGYAGGYSATGGSTSAITFQEILGGQTGTTNVSTQIGDNIKKNGLMAVGSLILIKVAQKAVVGLGVNRSINKLSDSVGLGSTVRAN